jgi:prepilin-type N-terminal cleavage/methylation domain-containing protein
MSPRYQHGFTLVELVVVMMLAGILSGMVSSFISAPMTSYVTLSQRASLMDKAENALSLVTRDVQQALPNSLRVRHIQFCDANGDNMDGAAETKAINSNTALTCTPSSIKKDYVVLEMIHVDEGVRYRSRNCDTTLAAGCNTTVANRNQLMLDLTAPDNQFGIIGAFQYIDPSRTDYRLVTGHNPSITSTTASNAYSNGGVITPLGTTVNISVPAAAPNINQNLASASFPGGTAYPSGTVTENQITLSTPVQFFNPTATHSPFQRLFVTEANPARIYLCDPQTGEIFRYRNYTMNLSMDGHDTRGELDNLLSGGAVRALVSNDMLNCRMVYNTTAGGGATARVGVVKISLVMTQRNLPSAEQDQIRLFKQINVFNVD